MVDLTKLDTHRAEVAALQDAYNELYRLMFTNNRNLSDAGRGVLSELKRRNMRQCDGARILGISPTAAHNNW